MSSSHDCSCKRLPNEADDVQKQDLEGEVQSEMRPPHSLRQDRSHVQLARGVGKRARCRSRTAQGPLSCHWDWSPEIHGRERPRSSGPRDANSSNPQLPTEPGLVGSHTHTTRNNRFIDWKGKREAWEMGAKRKQHFFLRRIGSILSGLPNPERLGSSLDLYPGFTSPFISSSSPDLCSSSDFRLSYHVMSYHIRCRRGRQHQCSLVPLEAICYKEKNFKPGLRQKTS